MIDTTIEGVLGRRIWDSRGRPTVEAEIRLAGGASGRAIAPAGASVGSGEATDKRDRDGWDVTEAVAAVNEDIASALYGMEAADQALLDGTLVQLDATPDRSSLGGNALIAVSMAAAHAAAAAHRQPLWRYLCAAPPARLPLPEIQIFGGGVHASRRVDIQDFMVIAVGADDYAQALDRTARVYRAAGRLMDETGRLQGVADEGGYWPAFDNNAQALDTLVRAIERAGFTPGQDVAISLDVAASEFGRRGRYTLAQEGLEVDSDALCELLLDWLARYPIVAIEDPLAEDDVKGFARFTQAAGGRVQIVGDDLLVTDATRVTEAGMKNLCNTALIKPNQAGTLTETRAALDAARGQGMGAIVSARSGESEDVTIVHLAVGWGVHQLKVGSFARSERTAKWNEGLRIAEALESGSCLPEARLFPWGRA